MKKRKILIPALGLLALSTVASVTGTVAWFTANATVSTSFSKFGISKLSSDLELTVAAGAGTIVETTGTGKNTKYAVKPTKVSDSEYATLTHASVNSFTGDVFSKDTTNNTIKVDGKTANIFDNFTTTNTKLIAKKNNAGVATTYYAISWDCTFGYTVTNSTDVVNLYFDTRSTTTTTTDKTSGQIRTYKGFRLGMYTMAADNKSATHTVVWSPDQAFEKMTENDDSTTPGNKKSCYVDDLVTPAVPGGPDYTTADYTATQLIYKGDSTVPYIDTTEKGSASRKDCLGQFTGGASAVSSIKVKFIAWYEGEDVNVIDTGTLDEVAANLAFYIRVNQAA